MNKFPLDFIGIGVDRGATYWVTECLRAHPEIQFAKQKEVGFFNEYDQHFLETKNPRYFRGMAWYATFFPERQKGKVMGEYTPTYIFTELAAKRIKENFPNVKLICTLRDPVKRAFSQYLHDISIGLLTNISFESTLKKHKAYYAKGQYARYLENYYKHFKKKQILILLVDDIKNNPEREVKKLYKFLGLKNVNFQPPELHNKTNSAAVARFPYINKLLLGGEVLMINKKMETIHKLLEDLGVRKFVFWLTYNLNRKHIKEDEYPKINPKTEKVLRKRYLKDIEKLEKLIGRNLKAWK